MMSTPDSPRPVLEYQPPEDDSNRPLDIGEQRVAAALFALGILVLVVIGMALVVQFVIRSLL